MKDSFLHFSDAMPPLVHSREVIHEAVAHLSAKDEKLGALRARVGADALELDDMGLDDMGEPKPPTQARLGQLHGLLVCKVGLRWHHNDV